VDGALIKEFLRSNGAFSVGHLGVGEKKSDKDALVSTTGKVYVLHQFMDD
jgi:hypothetical protein